MNMYRWLTSHEWWGFAVRLNDGTASGVGGGAESGAPRRNRLKVIEAFQWRRLDCAGGLLRSRDRDERVSGQCHCESKHVCGRAGDRSIIVAELFTSSLLALLVSDMNQA